MKRTRKDLVEFMIETSKEYGKQFCISNPWMELKFFADKLISEGWVQIPKPLEWYVCFMHNCAHTSPPSEGVYCREYHRWEREGDGKNCPCEWIKVREVEDSND